MPSREGGKEERLIIMPSYKRTSITTLSDVITLSLRFIRLLGRYIMYCIVTDHISSVIRLLSRCIVYYIITGHILSVIRYGVALGIVCLYCIFSYSIFKQL